MHEILVYFKSGILEKNSNRFGLKQKDPPLEKLNSTQS